MKKFIFLALFLLLINSLKSQDFAPIGAKWHYTEKFAFSGEVSYMWVFSVGNTLIKGKICRKLSSNGGYGCGYNEINNYIYEQDSVVYFYLAAKDSFQILYDFKAPSGSSWNIIINNDITPAFDTLNVKVDSISYVNINGFNLKKQWVTYSLLNSVYQFHYNSQIIEKIGDVNYLFYLLGSSYAFCDANYSEGLRCYSDSVFGFYNTGIASSCTYTGISETKKDNIEIYPNPVTDLLNIKTASGNLEYIELRNTLGQLVYSTYFKSEISINLKNFPKGLYLVKLRDNEKILALKKILKI